MESNYFSSNNSKKVIIWIRLVAKLVDFFFVMVIATFFYPLGIFAGAIYLILADSIQDGQSIGKKIWGLHVISLKDGTSCSFHQSLTRNLPFLIPLLIGVIPLWGWLLGLMVFCTVVLLELYLIIKLDSGHRLGDVMADTAIVREKSGELSYSKKRKSWFHE